MELIVAVDSKWGIGKNGGLLAHLPSDMKYFREHTEGKAVVMGRKTFESLPKGALPNRRNIVLSRSKRDFPGAETFASLNEALAACNHSEGAEDVYIIGGASVYAEALPLANRLCLTEVHDTPNEADAFFPEFNREEWNVTFREAHEKDEKHDQCFDFVDYCRP